MNRLRRILTRIGAALLGLLFAMFFIMEVLSGSPDLNAWQLLGLLMIALLFLRFAVGRNVGYWDKHLR